MSKESLIKTENNTENTSKLTNYLDKLFYKQQIKEKILIKLANYLDNLWHVRVGHCKVQLQRTCSATFLHYFALSNKDFKLFFVCIKLLYIQVLFRYAISTFYEIKRSMK